jgi:hypothetical protein
MTPPIFPAIVASNAVTDWLGLNPTRFYPFKDAPQDGVRPYAVYQVINGTPENYLDDASDIDQVSVQIDVYADDGDDSESIAKVIRAAIEGLCYVTSFRDWGKEPKTLLYRYMLEVDWFVER